MSRARYRRKTVDEVRMFYREAGSPDAPTIVLLHGLPGSSHMYRGLLEKLSGELHVVAPDYPGFGNSDAPSPSRFDYTFDHLAEVVDLFLERVGVVRCSFYMQGYGVSVGLRVASRRPNLVDALVFQNGTVYEEGFSPLMEPLRRLWKSRDEHNEEAVSRWLGREGVVRQHLDGAHDPERISPDAWNLDLAALSDATRLRIQLELLYDYRNDVELFPRWQQYFRERKPPGLVVWGKNDPFLNQKGALAFRRDLEHLEIHLLEAGRYALEEEGDFVAKRILSFLGQLPERNTRSPAAPLGALFLSSLDPPAAPTPGTAKEP